MAPSRRRPHSPSVSTAELTSSRHRRPSSSSSSSSSSSNPMAAPADVVPPASDIARQQNVNIPRPQNVTSSPPPTMVGGAEGICAQQKLSFHQEQRQNHQQKTTLELMKLLKHEIDFKLLHIKETLAHIKKGGPVDDQAADAEAKFAQLQTDFKELNPQTQIYTQSAPKAPSLEEGGPFDTLTNEDECRVRHALDGGNSSDEVLLVHKASNIELKRVTLQCLKDKGLLNDEVIDLYLQLLKERELREPNKFLKCHFFNTFFYEKLNGKNGGYHYEAVRSWTKKKKLGYNIIDCDKIFVPIHEKFIHKESHWCLAVINIRDKKFQYLDSLGFEDMKALEILARYLVDEIKDKNNKQIDVLSWEQEVVKNVLPRIITQTVACSCSNTLTSTAEIWVLFLNRNTCLISGGGLPRKYWI